MQLKQCLKCKELKPLSMFYGSFTYCKLCGNVYYLKNKTQLAVQTFEYKKNNTAKYLFKTIKSRAKTKNIQFDINIEYIKNLLKNNICPLLGIEMKINKAYSRDNSYSIDRINPNEGYIKGNIQIISHKANSSKSNTNISEYENLVNKLEHIITYGVKINNIFKAPYKLDSFLYKSKERSKTYNLLYDIDKEYLKSIYPIDNKCPLLNIELKKGSKISQPCSPTLDRIIPQNGYLKGNVMFLSHRANTIKNNLTLDEMKLLLSNWKRI